MKLSELPVGTVVDFEGRGEYEKRDSGKWFATMGHCVDCMDDDFIKPEEIVADDVLFIHSVKGGPFLMSKIVSMPYSIVLSLAHQLADMYKVVGLGDITINGLIRDAIEEDKRQKELKEARNNWQHMDSFENVYMEINESGQVRFDDRGIVYSPIFDEEENQWVVILVDPNNGEEFNIDPRHFVKRHFNKDYI